MMSSLPETIESIDEVIEDVIEEPELNEVQLVKLNQFNSADKYSVYSTNGSTTVIDGKEYYSVDYSRVRTTGSYYTYGRQTLYIEVDIKDGGTLINTGYGISTASADESNVVSVTENNEIIISKNS